MTSKLVSLRLELDYYYYYYYLLLTSHEAEFC